MAAKSQFWYTIGSFWLTFALAMVISKHPEILAMYTKYKPLVKFAYNRLMDHYVPVLMDNAQRAYAHYKPMVQEAYAHYKPIVKEAYAHYKPVVMGYVQTAYKTAYTTAKTAYSVCMPIASSYAQSAYAHVTKYAYAVEDCITRGFS